MHFAQMSIEQYLTDSGKVTSDIWSNDHNYLPDHLKEYLSEKAKKYLGSDIPVDYNKTLTVMYGTILVEDIDNLILYFEPYIDKISSDNNYFPEEIDNYIVPGWVVSPAKTVGAQYPLSNQITEYIKVYYTDEIKELIRDYQIRNILR